MHTILIIDDEPEIRRLMGKRLSAAGYRIIEAENGRSGLDSVKAHNPDLILCDIVMPGLNGLDFLKTLRRDCPKFADIPFIFVTGQHGRADTVKGLSLGADDYLTKPVDGDILLTKVRSTLNRISRLEQRMKEEMDALRTSVLSALPHELRTPLTHIIGFSEILKNEVHGPIGNRRYAEYVSDIYAGGQQLLGIVNGSLELIDVLCGRTLPIIQTVDTLSFLDDCAAAFQEISTQTAINLVVVRADANVPMMATDPALLRQAVNAVLSNAVKFSPPMGRIELSAATDETGGVSISVRDTGTGIEPAQVERLFQTFEQYESGDTRQHGGAGIGLTMVRALMNILDGQVTIDSQPGIGTTVSLDVTAAAKNTQRAQQLQANSG